MKNMIYRLQETRIESRGKKYERNNLSRNEQRTAL